MTASRGVAVPKQVWPGLAVGLALGFVLTTTAENILVMAPLAIGLLATIFFYWALWHRRDARVPWFELGAVYVAALSLYMAYPLVGYLALGQTYTPVNDQRLYVAQPDAAEVGSIGWLYTCHLATFGLAYMVFRGRLPLAERPLRTVRPDVVLAAAALYACVEAFGLFVGLFYNMSASTYAETYMVSRRLPLLVSQLLNHLGGVKFSLALILLTALFGRYHKYRLVIVGLLLLVAAVSAARLGSRTELVLLLMAAVMMYHRIVRPISPRAVIAAGAVGLTAFLALGLLRSMRAGSLDLVSANPFAYGSEFESLFANAVHLNRIKHTIGELPVAFYLADLAAVIPQQIAPFTKVDRADWYVATFFPDYAAAGGGLAFGTISEAVLAGGWMAAMALGAALGFAFAKIHRFYAPRADRFWVLVLYVWVATLSYQSLRNSTFALLVLFVFRFVPALVLVHVLAELIKTVRRGRQGLIKRSIRAPQAPTSLVNPY